MRELRTIFRQLDREQGRQLGAIRTELVMLQYGGNTVPYIEDESAQRYGRWFTSQIRLFNPFTWCPHHRDWAVDGAQSGDAHGNLPQHLADALKEAAQ